MMTFQLMMYAYDFDDLSDYVNNMSEKGTSGNQEILLATANLLMVKIVVILALGLDWSQHNIINYMVSSSRAFH